MKVLCSISVAALALALSPISAEAAGRAVPHVATSVTSPTFYSWMSPDVRGAWNAGYRGQGTTITMVDEFSGNDPFWGKLNNNWQDQLHGYWTTEEAGMIAPSANIARQSFNSGTAVKLAPTGLNVINASYAMYANAGYAASSIAWSAQEASIIQYAKNGQAVISKAAGNDAVAVGTAVKSGSFAGDRDYLATALIGTQSSIFAGALNSNGTPSKKASLASYSNYAGSDAAVQSHFLVVGVAGNQTSLYGTSFAAPVISGYAAILGSKFKAASATQITNQLLNTARTDTLVNYNPSTYGRGEASLANALAPVAIH